MLIDFKIFAIISIFPFHPNLIIDEINEKTPQMWGFEEILKGINYSITLADALKSHSSVDEALTKWNSERTATNNGLVQFGNQLGLALVKQIPDWSKMNPVSMEEWFSGVVTIATEYLPATQ